VRSSARELAKPTGMPWGIAWGLPSVLRSARLSVLWSVLRSARLSVLWSGLPLVLVLEVLSALRLVDTSHSCTGWRRSGKETRRRHTPEKHCSRYWRPCRGC
jgi:hypothetical protein